jgi:hypothetical protein
VTVASTLLTLTHFLKPDTVRLGQLFTTFAPSFAALLQKQDLSRQIFLHLHLLFVTNPLQELAGVALTSTYTAWIAEITEEVSRFTVVKRSKSCALHSHFKLTLIFCNKPFPLSLLLPQQ